VGTNPADQQLGHRVRVGRAVSAQSTAARRRVEAALTDELDVRELTGEERVVFNADLAASISVDPRHPLRRGARHPWRDNGCPR
jgi:hypothetical protein